MDQGDGLAASASLPGHFDSLFNLVTIPAFDPTSRTLAEQLQELHETLGTLILALAGLHAAAALVHHYLLRDTVLARMLPRA